MSKVNFSYKTQQTSCSRKRKVEVSKPVLIKFQPESSSDSGLIRLQESCTKNVYDFDECLKSSRRCIAAAAFH